MQITLNGETHSCQAQTVQELMQELGYTNKRVAVELNGDIVPKSEHAETLLRTGDQLEIVVAVGGG